MGTRYSCSSCERIPPAKYSEKDSKQIKEALRRRQYTFEDWLQDEEDVTEFFNKFEKDFLGEEKTPEPKSKYFWND